MFVDITKLICRRQTPGQRQERLWPQRKIAADTRGPVPAHIRPVNVPPAGCIDSLGDHQRWGVQSIAVVR